MRCPTIPAAPEKVASPFLPPEGRTEQEVGVEHPSNLKTPIHVSQTRGVPRCPGKEDFLALEFADPGLLADKKFMPPWL